MLPGYGGRRATTTTMFTEPTMSTSLQVLISEICQKMSVIPVIISRVPNKSKKRFLPSIAFLLDQLHEVVANINNNSSSSNNNYLNDNNNNFTWDVSHDFPVYEDNVNFNDLEEMLCGGSLDVPQTRGDGLDVPQSRGGGLDVPQSRGGGLDVPQSRGGGDT